MNTKPPKPQIETIVIDNWQGSLTQYLFGNPNSGKIWNQVSSGQNPYVKPNQLTWSEAPSQIDSAGSVITDLILAGKERIESGISYVYAIGHTGRLYKIQVNDPTTYNPDYDTPVLLATLSSNSPTFKRGAFMDFFGTTNRIYIGHDKGVTRIDFDGTNETFVGVLGSWTQDVPRPLHQFLGNLYAGSGTNLAEITSSATVNTYTKLSPGFPTATQVRDLDVNPDGTYLQAVVSNTALPDITLSTQDTTSDAPAESYVFKWNGTDVGYTSFITYPSLSLNANVLFQNFNYVFGSEQSGASMYNPTEKKLQMPEAASPLPNAVTSVGNIVFWMAPIYFNGVLEADLYAWGTFDFEIANPLGNYDLMFLNAKSPQTDIIRVPLLLSVSNVGLGASYNGYSGNVFSKSKFYFSTLEGASGSTAYRFYKWQMNLTPDAAGTTPVNGAIVQTQSKMFSKKRSIKEVRIYGEPWITGNAFQIDLIGSGTSATGVAAMTNGTKVFSIGSGLTVGNDFSYWNPSVAPTYCIGIAVTNTGTSHHTISKIEIDHAPAGK